MIPPHLSVAGTLETLLAGAFDYSGLFPPAQLELPAVLANYRTYRASPDAWALGKLVIPADRLGELESLLGESTRAGTGAIPVSAVLGPDTSADVKAVEAFNRAAARHGARVESVETKGSAGAVRAALAAVPTGWTRYVEVSLGEAGIAALDEVARAHAFAKVRTGGMTQAAFPSPEHLIAFLEGALRRRLAFKATAGLHHPLRGTYRLTYAENAPSGVMYGYLNLLLAAAVLWTGGEASLAREGLLEEDPAALRADAEALVWRGERLARGILLTLRADFLHGFGSCSFREPMDELAAGGWQ